MVAIVLAYGIFQAKNAQYRQYLDTVLREVSQGNFDQVIICGGLTDPQSQLTEAQSIANYINSHYASLTSKLILEDTSITTTQNLQNAAAILQESGVQPQGITIFCDSIRTPKIFYFSLTFFGVLFNLKPTEEEIYLSLIKAFTLTHQSEINQEITLVHPPYTIRGINLNRSAAENSQQIVSTLLEIAALKYPSIDKLILTRRQAQWAEEMKTH